MGGEGPAVRFSPDNAKTSFWANRTGLKLFDSQEQETVYSKAIAFFLESGSKLIADFGWQEDTTDVTSILHLSKSTSHLLLPASFALFLKASEADKWSKMFNLFKAKRDRTNGNLFIDSPAPLADIFYLLQTILPGMLLIYRIDEIDDLGEQERSSALPPAAWVEEHKELLQMIFGDHKERFDRLLATAADHRLAQQRETIFLFDWEDDSDCYTNLFGQREMKDLTACDQECGYCGTCDY